MKKSIILSLNFSIELAESFLLDLFWFFVISVELVNIILTKSKIVINVIIELLCNIKSSINSPQIYYLLYHKNTKFLHKITFVSQTEQLWNKSNN